MLDATYNQNGINYNRTEKLEIITFINPTLLWLKVSLSTPADIFYLNPVYKNDGRNIWNIIFFHMFFFLHQIIA